MLREVELEGRGVVFLLCQCLLLILPLFVFVSFLRFERILTFQRRVNTDVMVVEEVVVHDLWRIDIAVVIGTAVVEDVL